MDGLVAELLEGARAEMAVVAEHGGAVEAVPYMKAALVDSHRERMRRIESGEQIVVGLNRFTEGEASPLIAGRRRRHPHRRPGGRGRSSATAVRAPGAPSATRPRSTPRWPSSRASPAPRTRTSCPRRSPPPARASRPASGRRRCATPSASTARRPASARPPRPSGRRRRARRRCATRSSASARRSGRRIKILVGKPGLDGHSNGAEQIAVRARDAGMDVVYEGIRLTPAADRARARSTRACT